MAYRETPITTWSRSVAADGLLFLAEFNQLYLDIGTYIVGNAGSAPAETMKQLSDNKVPITRTVNGHALSADVVVTKSDVVLGNVDNVQQMPLSYLDTDGTLAANSDTKVASQKAIKTYATPLSYLDTDGTLAANSDSKIATQKAIKTYVDGKGGAGEGHITIFPESYDSITQGTWGSYTTSGMWSGFAFQNLSSSAQNDQVNYKVYLAVGTYNFCLLHPKYNSCGIATIYFGATNEGTIDLYSSGTVYIYRSLITGIVISTPGIYTISIKIATKNPSSSGYYAAFNAISLWRTA